MREEEMFGKMSRLLTNKTFSAILNIIARETFLILQLTLNDPHL
jgi:hypothetical protein